MTNVWNPLQAGQGAEEEEEEEEKGLRNKVQ